jgi:peptide/nickel transport system permease protein
MTKFLSKRLGLALITLLILSAIVFMLGNLLPGDPGRATLGPLAPESAVKVLDHQYGTDKPLLTLYWLFISHFVQGNMGKSYTYQAPVRPLLFTAIGHSLKLALLAFVIVVPLGIFAGVFAALHVGKGSDRAIVVAGTSATVTPEIVSGIFLILVFGIWLNVLPISATAPQGAGFFDQIYHLILPAIPLVLVLFGYIARMARAGTVEALGSDYVRTAVLKGLPRRTVIRRHVLRNSLLPTITVIASQTGYLIGGLIVVETLFHYDGIGTLLYNAAQQKDFPMLEAGVLTIGIVYMLATLAADLLYSYLNPRIRFQGVE